MFRGWYNTHCYGDGDVEGGGGEVEGDGDRGGGDGDHGDGDDRGSGAPSHYGRCLHHDEGELPPHNGRVPLPRRKKKMK